ncbi:hypothetical protein XELAEV_18028331mg [Xenopus laevis]|uniref:Receptor ligand binding region domain-containing protein n=1 Tax=Xenopus laevis TaxID=8355 RepID=A0A974CWY7_XENLA|nr:hypothetical protein XELAEV_18028331mg [Xenopus laevis]
MLTLIILLLVVSEVSAASGNQINSRHGCTFRGHYYPVKFKAGDFPSLQNYRHYLAFQFAVDEINKSSKILPNISLGYKIYDSCANEVKTLYDMLAIMSGAGIQIPNYDCWQKAKLVGYLGDVTSSTKFCLAQIASMFRYPQASRSIIYYFLLIWSPGEAQSLSDFTFINKCLYWFQWRLPLTKGEPL